MVKVSSNAAVLYLINHSQKMILIKKYLITYRDIQGSSETIPILEGGSGYRWRSYGMG